RLDLDNTHGNTHYGIHTASMAGTWMGIANGFAGMRIVDGQLRFAPTLPHQWTHYQFKVHFGGAVLQVRVQQDQVIYTLVGGAALAFEHAGRSVSLNREQAVATIFSSTCQEAA
ncbi:MAG: glycosyl hydrolase family 65 protein, partial [Gammaproteobacteria bacterium]